MRDLDNAVKTLEPWLEARESERQSLVADVIRSAIVIAAFVLVIVVVLSATVAPLPFFIIGAVLLISGGVAWVMRPLNRLRTEIKKGLNLQIAEAFGLQYAERPNYPARFDSFRDHGLIPRWDRRQFEDHFTGEAHGATFELYEAHLKQKRKSKNSTRYVTVFRGVLMRIEFPKTLEGITLLSRDKGIFNSLESWVKKHFSGKKLERIGLVDPEFEKQFEVYGTDQVMARYLMTPSFMERVLDLEKALEGKNVRCVFDEGLHPEQGRGELLLCAETGNRFEAGSMFKPLNTRDRVESIHTEIKLIDEIIQTLLEPSNFPSDSETQGD